MSGVKQHIDKKNIATIFPLTPMQEAILGHSVRHRISDPGFLQLTCTLEGNVVEDTLERAWRHAMHEYPVLRTSLHWRELETPLQIVHKSVTVPWNTEDLRSLPLSERRSRLREYLDADRALPLQLNSVPAMRIALLRMTDNESTMVWSCHHALLDGWSGALVLSRVIEVYDMLARREEPTVQSTPPYRDYVRWLSQQEADAADAFWRLHLGSVEEPTPLPLRRRGDVVVGGASPGAQYERKQLFLSSELSGRVAGALRRRRVTLGTLFHAAWAVVLSHFSGREDVVFGATVSGRDGDLPGLETMVGLFINTIPVWARIEGSETIGAFAERLQREQSTARRFAHTPPEQVQACTKVPPRFRLYESLVVVENFPASESPDDSLMNGLRLRDLHGGITSNFPVTLVVGPGDKIALHLIHDSRVVEGESANQILNATHRIVEAFADDSDVAIHDLVDQSGVSEVADSPDAPHVPARPEVGAPFAPPRDDVELRLKQIWERLLGLNGVGIDDDFFDLGGHSLLGLALLKEIETEFVERLPVSVLFDNPTVRGLATILRDEEYVASWSPVVPIQPGGTGVPIFFLHSWDGDILMYRRVAAELADKHPVFGVQSYGLDGDSAPIASIDEMARRYVDELVAICPAGPVGLVGFCFSVPLSIEMARLLQARGREVALLLNIDTGKARLELARPKKNIDFYKGRFKRLYRERGLLGLLRYQYRRKLHRFIVRERADKAQNGDASPTVAEVLQRTTKAAYDAYFASEQPRYDGKMTVFLSQDRGNVPEVFGPIEFWRGRVADIESHEIEGGHTSVLLDPYVADLAASLQRCLTFESQIHKPS